MKKFPQIYYDPGSDTLAVELSDAPRQESYEPAPGVIITVGDDGDAVLIEFMGPVREWFEPLIKQRFRAPADVSPSSRRAAS